MGKGRSKKLLNYFEDNDLGETSSHQIDKARFKIYRVFDKYYFNDDSVMDEKLFIEDLRELIPEFKLIIKKFNFGMVDNRRGWETYGYEHPFGDLSYISDRWMSQFRMQWIIDLFDTKGGKF